MKLDQELDFSDPTYKFEAYNYQARANILLGHYKEASKQISKNKQLLTTFSEKSESEFLKAELESLVHYVKFLQDPSDSAAKKYFTRSDLPGGLSTLMCGYYYAKLGEYKTALTKLHPKEDLENAIFGSYLLLVLSQPDEAEKYLTDNVTNDAATETVGYNQASAWIQLAKYGDDLNSAYYHFDELTNSENTTSLKSLISTLVANIKLLHFPEAEDVLSQIASFTKDHKIDFPSWASDLLINKIALKSIQNKNDEADKLYSELQKKDPNCDYVKDMDEKSNQFDAIVAKYKA